MPVVGQLRTIRRSSGGQIGHKQKKTADGVDCGVHLLALSILDGGLKITIGGEDACQRRIVFGEVCLLLIVDLKGSIEAERRK